jgi:hypothetical protein
VTVYEAADLMGLTVDAIRKRIQRGTIPHERREDGRVYVLLDRGALREAVEAAGNVPDEAQGERPVHYRTGELVESLRDQVEFLRRELERKDAILLRMAERLPELEPAREPQGPTEPVSEVEEGAVGAPEEAPEGPSGEEAGPERRSWARRFFGL